MVSASITEMEDMIQVIVDVKVRDWVTARDMVMTVEVDENSVRRLMLYPYVGRTQVGRREMAPMIMERGRLILKIMRDMRISLTCTKIWWTMAIILLKQIRIQ